MTADQSDDEWQISTRNGADVVPVSGEPGVFRNTGGGPRHAIHSPQGKAWWRNIEMSLFLRFLNRQDAVTLYVRGERHSNGTVTIDDINDGVRAPPGTATWPGYPFSSPVITECLGTAYKVDVDSDGVMYFQKEISHTGGYTDRGGEVTVFSGGVPLNEWIGFKFVLRNKGANAERGVSMEAWMDLPNDNEGWLLISTLEDTGGWTGDPAQDGCDGPPFNYANDEIVSWAGPWAVLRTDADQQFDFKAFSIREIAPLP